MYHFLENTSFIGIKNWNVWVNSQKRVLQTRHLCSKLSQEASVSRENDVKFFPIELCRS